MRRGECWCFAFSFFFLALTPVFLGAKAEALTDAAVEILLLDPRFFLSSLELVLVLALVVVALDLALSSHSLFDAVVIADWAEEEEEEE